MNARRKNSILIVDDERSNISALRNMLSADYTVYASTDGHDAVATAEEFVPDLILLDIVMPDMDGYDVIKVLKNSEKTQGIPVIFITGLDNSEAEEKGLGLGASDYIPKPFNPAIVKLRVRNQIELIEQFRQQVLMTKISHNFLSDAYIDSLFADTLRVVGLFMDAAQVLLYKFDDNVLICQSEWMLPELDLVTQIGTRIELNEPLVSIIGSLKTDSEGIAHSQYPSFAAAMAPYRTGFGNYVTRPIFVKGKMCAVLDFSREDEGQEWSGSELNLAALIADIFSGVFERDAMERQFSIVENTPDLVLSITTDAAVEYVNPAVSTVTGYTKNDLFTEGLGIIFAEDTLDDLKKKHIPNAMRGEPVQFEIDIFRKCGEKRILTVSVFQRDKNSLGVIFRDLTKIRELEEENEKLFFDGLTGIYNRRFFDETILRIIKSLSRSGSVLSLMMIDIDFFKDYNDTYGHSAGDDCLKAVAALLSKNVPRADDFVARYGGEEFVIVLPNTDENGARIVAERLLAGIRERAIPHKTSAVADHVTFSIGFVTDNVKHTHTAGNFIKRADEMLYKSKHSGRNMYNFERL
ncbi:MAG: diguanylate cyclase [Defluviitaleaceae bacterium]|nr:diguanylate cyclase [Defluviitaleaceae bacterium]MCL2835113.1 diguanylate cyclase [Defluviitaleaceae bacterium]